MIRAIIIRSQYSMYHADGRMTTLTPQICPSGLPFAAASAPAPAPDHDPAALLPTRPLCSTSSSTNSSSKGISVDLDDERVFDAFSDERIFDAFGSSSECPGSPCLDSDERLEASATRASSTISATRRPRSPHSPPRGRTPHR